MRDIPQNCARSSFTKAPKLLYLTCVKTVDYSLQAVPLDNQLRCLCHVRSTGHDNSCIIRWNRGNVGLNWQKQRKEDESNCHCLEGDLDEHDGG